MSFWPKFVISVDYLWWIDTMGWVSHGKLNMSLWLDFIIPGRICNYGQNFSSWIRAWFVVQGWICHSGLKLLFWADFLMLGWISLYWAKFVNSGRIYHCGLNWSFWPKLVNLDWIRAQEPHYSEKTIFFYKIGPLFKVIMIENNSASYFKMTCIWTVESRNSIIHEPLWRQVDHTVTLVTSPLIYLATRKYNLLW